MALLDRFRRRRTGSAASVARGAAERNPPIAAQPGTTRIEREHFLLHAPFEWKAVRGDGSLEFEFGNQTLPEQLIVTVMLFREPMSNDAVRSTVRRLADIRLAAVSELSGGQAICAPVTLQSNSEQAEARCIGVDKGNRVRIAWVVRGTKSKIVMVALTRYSLEEGAVAFETYASVIFDLLQVKE